MTYLIMQMLFCLIITFILGVITGFLLGKILSGTKTKTDEEHVIPAFTDPDFDEDDLSAELDDMSDIDSDQLLDDPAFSVERLEGVGPRTAELFAKADIRTIGDYLRKLHRPEARETLAKELEIKVQPIHDWASMADLMRIDGVNHNFAELLYAAGIRTTDDLAIAPIDTLTEDLVTTNNAGKHRIAPEDPDETLVTHWITRAKTKKTVVVI